MSDKRRDDEWNGFAEGIARIRHLAEQMGQAHELIARNNELLSRDRSAIRSGALRTIDNFERVGAAVAECPAEDERPTRSLRPRRRRAR